MHVRPKIYAHRGGNKWAPENTLAAFKKSVEFGVDGIELDVHRCRSGELVVIHGGILGGDTSHTTDGKGLIKDLTLSELRKFSAGIKVSPRFTRERIPLLTEVFDTVRGRCALMIEVKNTPWPYPGIEEDLMRAIRAYRAPHTVTVSAFHHKSLSVFHKSMPGLKLGLLVDGLIVDIGRYARKLGFSVLNPYLGELTPDYVAEVKDAGLEIIAWTASNKDEWNLALELGVDGVITDDPVGLKRYLGSLHLT